MVGVAHYKARADIIIQSFTDKIPDETTMYFMAYYSMLCEHRSDGLKRRFSIISLGQFPHGDQGKILSSLLQIRNKIQEMIFCCNQTEQNGTSEQYKCFNCHCN